MYIINKRFVFPDARLKQAFENVFKKALADPFEKVIFLCLVFDLSLNHTIVIRMMFI